MRWLFALCFVAACQAPVDEDDGIDDAFLIDGKADVAGIAEGSPEARAVLELANDADYTVLWISVQLSKTAAANIIKYKEGVDLTVGTNDDRTFHTLKELDAVPYIGPKAFAKLLAFAQPPPPHEWWQDLPDGDFDASVPVHIPGRNTHCEPTCKTRLVGTDVTLRIFRAGGHVAMTLSNPTQPAFDPNPIKSDGFFGHQYTWSDADGNAVLWFNGRILPGRRLAIELYTFSYFYTAEMKAGWEWSISNSGPVYVTF